jgi:rfaE bifunctional protein kinase chain/domain
MTFSDTLDAFANLSVLVVGDICLDRWCQYDPREAEPSRETGIPRVAVVDCESTPGAGGTVANNLVALGAGRVAVLGAIGEDGYGHDLLRALAARGIESDLMVRGGGLRTFTYTKLLNRETGVEDLPRVDWINVRPLGEAPESEIRGRLLEFAGDFDAVIVSDQAETASGGVVTPKVRDALIDLATASSRVFWVDSRRRAELFRRMILKPNEDEAREACARAGLPDFAALREHTESRALIVTHGERGASVVDDRGESHAPARPVEPIDICGAGDSFNAAGAMAFAVTGDAFEAAKFGNLAASITIQKRGTGTASRAEMREAAGW